MAAACAAPFATYDTHAIQVEGHTDDTKIATSVFPSNWELSAVRASSVVRLFIDSGVAVTILSALPDTTTEIPTR